MSKLPHQLKSLCAVLGLLILTISTEANGQNLTTSENFDAAKAFCERQTFALEDINEVKPWLDYFSGLRNGRSSSPPDSCPSSTMRAIVGIVGSGSVEKAEDARAAFLSLYVSRGTEMELADRRRDSDGSFRYRNDIVLAGFVWLLCPGHSDQRLSCVKEVIHNFPAEFVSTSPVFCDFAGPKQGKVEWPPQRALYPLVCADNGQEKSENSDAWLRQAGITLGD
ncbi:hypothetical protein LAV84_21010 [Rhizobium sp. VS19-DR104.2]|uniref:hypothetical protein n=1 Tax=unclassified Rhizobium TaxID=2613769 RepID=UPI001CC45BBE|nr:MULTISPECIES: hypothetical protein [unclassified Rhizobium]MBZ5762396.1 hypothetical protein [Rhizobium sp. VS19-DR96]MBZ5768453.1 hypothetical protein [Rhizobium sp. VS19-DR129.2]MBZ5776107.1 hypothetical protein [Rhizobium sp. VS19-DRK62.2]MBZ5786202.1 hypothetical protein [Rhizobium sp. VS19-DR121]MBZ5804474.1 hypothetical protein [Rhizobium sp. VS19-DR181]